MKMKKRIKKKLSKGEPHNYSFWCRVLYNPNEVKQFVEKGDKRQKDCIRLTLQHMKKTNIDLFEELKGRKIIKLLNEEEY